MTHPFTSMRFPHAGYHGRLFSLNGRNSRDKQPLCPWPHRSFFEGWYFRIALPHDRQSFAFMYSIEESGTANHRAGGMMQVLGPGDQLAWRSLPSSNGFWADRHQLALGHWGGSFDSTIDLGPLDEPDFFTRIPWGYQASDRLNQGHFTLPCGSGIRWQYRIEKPICYGNTQPEATMGWLSYLPIFEPGWQILQPHAEATGWVDWYGQRYEFVRAPAYAEKNWGGAFPLRWFWMQCNRFERTPSLSLTCAGGIREVLGWQQAVGMVALHWNQHFVKCVPENSRCRWQVEPWGQWEFESDSDRYRVRISGRTDSPPARVMVPTATGMEYECWDTTCGELDLRVWHRSNGQWMLILDDRSTVAGLEIGGKDWDRAWEVPS